MAVHLTVSVLKIGVSLPSPVTMISNQLMIALIVSSCWHAGEPSCSRCLDDLEVAGPEMAEKKRWSLAFMHRVGDTAGRVFGRYFNWADRRGWSTQRCLIVLCVALFPVSCVLFTGLGLLLPDEVVSLLVVLVAAFGVAIFRAKDVHAKLSLWCPWCRGGDGDDDWVPVVPPTPEGVRSV